jgi:Kef-type K+ transport system membrane component KefB
LINAKSIILVVVVRLVLAHSSWDSLISSSKARLKPSTIKPTAVVIVVVVVVVVAPLVGLHSASCLRCLSFVCPQDHIS